MVVNDQGRDAQPSNSGISAAIERRLGEMDIAAELAADGVTTVSIDDDGQMVEHRPDGTTRELPRARAEPRRREAPSQRQTVKCASSLDAVPLVIQRTSLTHYHPPGTM